VDEACLALLRQGGQHQQSGGNLKQTLVLENKFITYYSFFITLSRPRKSLQKIVNRSSVFFLL